MDRREIEDLLDEIGIPLNIKGYRCLVEATLIVNEEPLISTANIYKKVAQKLNTTPLSIERNIRFIHERRNDKLKDFFKINCKFNNGILIYAITREVKRRGS